MGWTCCRYSGKKTSIELLGMYSSMEVGKIWHNDDESMRWEITDLAQGKGAVYGIIKKTDLKTGLSGNSALVILFTRRKGEICWKEMSELDGPYEAAMPQRLFKKLTDLSGLVSDSCWVTAQAWREQVRLYHANRPQKIQVGDLLEFVEPINFSVKNASLKISRFKVMIWGRKKVLQALPDAHDAFLCRLRRYSWNQEFKVLPATSAP